MSSSPSRACSCFGDCTGHVEPYQGQGPLITWLLKTAAGAWGATGTEGVVEWELWERGLRKWSGLQQRGVAGMGRGCGNEVQQGAYTIVAMWYCFSINLIFFLKNHLCQGAASRICWATFLTYHSLATLSFQK